MKVKKLKSWLIELEQAFLDDKYINQNVGNMNFLLANYNNAKDFLDHVRKILFRLTQYIAKHKEDSMRTIASKLSISIGSMYECLEPKTQSGREFLKDISNKKIEKHIPNNDNPENHNNTIQRLHFYNLKTGIEAYNIEDNFVPFCIPKTLHKKRESEKQRSQKDVNEVKEIKEKNKIIQMEYENNELYKQLKLIVLKVNDPNKKKLLDSYVGDINKNLSNLEVVTNAFKKFLSVALQRRTFPNHFFTKKTTTGLNLLKELQRNEILKKFYQKFINKTIPKKYDQLGSQIGNTLLIDEQLTNQIKIDINNLTEKSTSSLTVMKRFKH